MVERVKIHKELLKALHILKPKYRNVLLRACGDQEINCISECVFNVLRGKIPLGDKDKSKLKKHKSLLRKIISKGKNKLRRRIIIQKGGSFLPIVLGAVLNFLLNSITK